MAQMKVTVVDYGIGNLFSVQRALEVAGAAVSLSADPDVIRQAERVVLPGVGAFADGMAGLEGRGLTGPLRDFAATGRPLLGICLGMQMLATLSEEFGQHAGLDLVPGRVRALPGEDAAGRPHKIPHIGWVEIAPPQPGLWAGTLLAGTAPGTAVYLVHSFAVVPDDPRHVLAVCQFGGHAICTAIRRDNIMGCQFHPEKSGQAGLAMLGRFLAL